MIQYHLDEVYQLIINYFYQIIEIIYLVMDLCLLLFIQEMILHVIHFLCFQCSLLKMDITHLLYKMMFEIDNLIHHLLKKLLPHLNSLLILLLCESMTELNCLIAGFLDLCQIHDFIVLLSRAYSLLESGLSFYLLFFMFLVEILMQNFIFKDYYLFQINHLFNFVKIMNFFIFRHCLLLNSPHSKLA